MTITITVSPERYKEILIQSEQKGLSKSAYCREAVFLDLDTHPRSALRALRIRSERPPTEMIDISGIDIKSTDTLKV